MASASTVGQSLTLECMSEACDGMQLDKIVEEPLHHSQHDCTSQEGRRLGYQPPPYDQTPCYLNEKTCTKQFAQTSLGNNVTVTFDWKHLMYEDYDRALFESWEKDGGPHYLFVSPGESLDKDILSSQGKAGSNVAFILDWKHLVHEDNHRALFESWGKKRGLHCAFVTPGEL